MLKAIKEFFTGKPKEEPINPQITDAVTQAPYKVPEPAATTPIPLVVKPEPPAVIPVAGLMLTSEAAPVAAKTKKTPAPKKAPAVKKAPAAKKAPAKKAVNK
jgi:hypothetical protein